MTESVENGVTVYRGSPVPHVYEAMIAVKRKISAIGIAKTRDAGAGGGPKYMFRGIDDVYNALCEIEAQEGLMVLPRIIAERTEYQTNSKGNLQTHVHITMELKCVSMKDGSSDLVSAIGEGIDSGDKASGKAQSNAMKQAHLQLFKIPTEGLSEDIEQTNQQVGPKVPATLENKLAVSVDWGNWEAEQHKALQACASPGELLETYSRCAAEGRGSPNGTLKRIAETKDKMKKSLQILQASP